MPTTHNLDGATNLALAREYQQLRFKRRAVVLDHLVREVSEVRSIDMRLMLDAMKEYFGQTLDFGAAYSLRRQAWREIVGTLPPSSRRGAKRAKIQPSPSAHLTPFEVRLLRHLSKEETLMEEGLPFSSFSDMAEGCSSGAGLLMGRMVWIDSYCRLVKADGFDREAVLETLPDPPQTDPERMAAQTIPFEWKTSPHDRKEAEGDRQRNSYDYTVPAADIQLVNVSTLPPLTIEASVNADEPILMLDLVRALSHLDHTATLGDDGRVHLVFTSKENQP